MTKSNMLLSNTNIGYRVVLAVLILIIIGGTPFVVGTSSYTLVLVNHALIAGLVALSLDILTGNTGLLSFGQAGWYGFGAYAGGLAAKYWTSDLILLLILVIVATIVLASAIGYILTYQNGTAFAILTLALSQIFFALTFVFPKLTGGEDGLQGIPAIKLVGVPLADTMDWYWVIATIVVGAVVAMFYARSAPIGKSWLAVRENTQRARFIGLNTHRLSLEAYTLSAVVAAIAGVLLVTFNGAVAPDVMHWFESGKIIMYTIVGGIGTIAGPVLGGIVFVVLEDFLSSFTQAWLIYLGSIFVVFIIVAPKGIAGVLVDGLKTWNVRRNIDRGNNGNSESN